MPDFLQLSGKTFVVFGVANRKSVGWLIAKSLEEQGARVVYSVRSEARRKSLETMLAGKPVFICDVEHEGAAARLADEISAAGHAPLHGLVHSIAFANYSEGFKAFHETKRADYLQATAVSAFSLVEIANAFIPHLVTNAAVVSRGISARLGRCALSPQRTQQRRKWHDAGGRRRTGKQLLRQGNHPPRHADRTLGPHAIRKRLH